MTIARRTLALIAVAAMTPVLMPALADVAPNTPAAVAAPRPVTTGLAILSPQMNDLLDTRSTRIVVRAAEGDVVHLMINGVAVSDKQVGSVTASADGQIVETWIGVSLVDGRNVVSARVDRGDQPSAPVETIVNVRGGIAKMSLHVDHGSIVADGRSLVSITGRLLDVQNNAAARDALVRLTSTAGEFVGVSAQPESNGYFAKAVDGQFTAILRASLHSGTAHIEARTGNTTAEIDVAMTTELRKSVATGIFDVRFGARETNFYDSMSKFLNADPSRTPEAQTTFFATGKVGNYLLTAAADNQYPINPACDGRIGVTTYESLNSCQPQYRIYGDESTYDRLAQSSDNVFVRIEREKSYAMWGDYDTKEFSSPTQMYSAMQRNLHGAKLNSEPHKLEVAGLYGNNVNAFQRDTLAPDGTSGYYYLSHQIITPGSESVYVESHLFDQPGIVTSITPYSRGGGYDIDYDRGAILFQAPIARTDVDNLGRVVVNQIVTTYEYDDGSGGGNIVAARLRYKSSLEQASTANPFSIGGTLIHQNMGISNFQLTGADIGIPLGKGAKFVGEMAHSSNLTDISGAVAGNAYRAEAELHSGRTNANAYYRTSSSGFSNNATTSFVPGQTQQGLTLDTPIAPKTEVFAQYDRQRQTGVAPELLLNPIDLLLPGSEPIPGVSQDTDVTTIGGGVRRKIGRGTFTAQYDSRQVYDGNAPGLDSNSGVLGARFVLPFAKRWEFVALDDINTRVEEDPAYPSRFAVGVDYQVLPGVKLAVTHQDLHGGQFGSRSFNSLESQVEEKISNDTSFIGRYAIMGGIDGSGGQSEFGIKHLIRVAKGVRANIAYEEIGGGIFDLSPSGLQFPQPYAVGQAGATALGVTGGTSLSLGADYLGSKYLKGNARYEHRVSSEGSNTTYQLGGAAKVSTSMSFLAAFDRANGANQTLGGLAASSDFRVGAAFRDPMSDATNLLLRYEVRNNPGLTPSTLLLGAGTWTRDRTFAVEVIHETSRRLELYGKFAFRDSSAFLAGDFSNETYTSLAQTRAQYRIGRKWDAVGELRWISQAVSNYGGLGESFEAGYAFGEDFRGAVGYSFGKANDQDFLGSRTRGGFYLDFTARVLDLTRNFGLQQAPVSDLSGAGAPAQVAAGHEVSK